MSQGFTICLCSIGSDSWTLPCEHVFHPRCIWSQYKANINRIDEFTFERFVPKCPNCRKIFHKKDLPPRERVAKRKEVDINPELLQQPAISSMTVSERPLRLARETFVVVRERTKSLLDDLVRRRAKLIEQNAEPTPGSSRDCNSGRSNSGHQSGILNRPGMSTGFKKLTVLYSSSSSSQESEDLPKSQQSKGSRSRSPLSQRAPSPFLRQSQELQTEGMYQPFGELQEVQMQISILEHQLELAAEMPARNQPSNDINLDDNVSIASYDDDAIVRQPLDIIGDIGRGRHTKYIIQWSDGTETVNKTRDVQNCAPRLLETYRRRIRARNTRLCRQNKKNIKIDTGM